MNFKKAISKHTLSSMWSSTRWLWNVWQGHRMQATLNTLIGILNVAAGLTFVWATKLTIDIATHADTRLTLNEALLLLSAILVVEIGLGMCSRWIRATLGVKAQNSMQSRTFGHLLHSTWRGLQSYHSGDMLNRIEKDVTTVVGYLTESLPALITTIVQFTGAFLFLFLMDRTLALIIVFLLPVFLIISRLYVSRMKALTHQVRSTESRIQALVQESIQHNLVIKTLERCATILANLGTLQGQLCGEVRHKTRYSLISSAVMNIGFSAGYLFTFGWGVHNLSEGLITYGALIAFVQLVGQIQGPARNLTRFIPIFISAYTSAERLIELERIPPEDTETNTKRLEGGVGIRLSDVTFSYAPTEREIISSLNFEFLPGSRTAILGETGAGKTTLVRLLLALVKPTRGSITLHDAANCLPATPASRSLFAYVPQGNTLLSGTIRSNLLLGNPKATPQHMEHALRIAQADFVFSLPEGLDTPCGEQGGGLSEGQAQRISIARTLLRDAPILLFDEATSALDNDTEAKVIEQIVHHFSDRTLIFVTHRPRVLEYCTQRLHMERGKA